MSLSAPASRRTIDQSRADHAWHAVKQIVDHHSVVMHEQRVVDEVGRKFGIHARQLPTRIMASGLGQALVFLLAKGYAPGLLTEIGDWVLNKPVYPDDRRTRPNDRALLERVIKGNSDGLRRATDETLAYLRWLIRFAEAEGLTEGMED